MSADSQSPYEFGLAATTGVVVDLQPKGQHLSERATGGCSRRLRFNFN